MASQIIIVIGGKGGAGATTFSVELARAALRKNETVALIDADLSARRSVGVLLDEIRAIDSARTSANISSTVVSGLTVVEMTATIDGAFTIVPADVEAVMKDVTDSCNMIIVDAPQPYAAAIRPFVARAQQFVLVIEPSILGVTGARAVQSELEKFGISPTNLVCITSSRDNRPQVSRREVETALGVGIAAEIPPLGDRRYAKAMDGLLQLLVTRTVEITTLSPSVTVPIGDRRSRGSRRPDPGEAAPAAPLPKPKLSPEQVSVQRAAMEARDRLKAEIHMALAERIDSTELTRGGDDASRMAELRSEVSEVVNELLADHPGVGSAEDVAHLRQEIIDEALGLGPIEDLLRQHDVTEIMVNGHGKVYAERMGRIELTAKRFSSDRHVRLVIERIVAPLGRRIDEAQPMVDARLADGSRVNAIIEPLAIDGPTLTIRKFPERRMNANDLIGLNSINLPLVNFLRACVEARLNVLVSGGTGSGKTTLLNVLSSFISTHERIITIEDAAELSLDQDHVVRLEARPPNIQGAGEVTIRDLVRNSLRMRPDRIIVGECRGGEALDMLQAMNTGHDGSLTTVHANSARDALSRIETLVLMAGFDLPVRAIREQVAAAMDVIVQVARLRDGTRKVTSVSEVVGLEGDVVTMSEIALYDQRGVDEESKVIGDFKFTGVQPHCLKRFDEMGISYDVRELSTLQSVANW